MFKKNTFLTFLLLLTCVKSILAAVIADDFAIQVTNYSRDAYENIMVIFHPIDFNETDFNVTYGRIDVGRVGANRAIRIVENVSEKNTPLSTDPLSKNANLYIMVLTIPDGVGGVHSFKHDTALKYPRRIEVNGKHGLQPPNMDICIDKFGEISVTYPKDMDWD